MSLLLDAIKKAEQREKSQSPGGQFEQQGAQLPDDEPTAISESSGGATAAEPLELAINPELLEDSPETEAGIATSPQDYSTTPGNPPSQTDTTDYSAAEHEATTTGGSSNSPLPVDAEDYTVDWTEPSTRSPTPNGVETDNTESVTDGPLPTAPDEASLAAQLAQGVDGNFATAQESPGSLPDNSPLAPSTKDPAKPRQHPGSIPAAETSQLPTAAWSPFRLVLLLLVVFGGAVAFYFVDSLRDNRRSATVIQPVAVDHQRGVDSISGFNSSVLDQSNREFASSISPAGNNRNETEQLATEPVQQGSGRLTLAESPAPVITLPGYTDTAPRKTLTISAGKNLTDAPAQFDPGPSGNELISPLAADAPIQSSSEDQAVGRTNTGKLSIEKTDSDLHLTLQRQAQKALNQGDYALAQELYSRWLSLRPDAITARFGIAATAMMTANTDSAREQYEQILQQQPGNPAAYAALLKLATSGSGNLSALQTLHDLHPEDPYLNYLLGNHHAELKQWRIAQHHYFAASTAAPQHAGYAFNLAVALEQIGQAQTALNFYRKAANGSTMPLSPRLKTQALQRIEILQGSPLSQ